MDTHLLRCEVLLINDTPPEDPERFLFLEQVTCSGVKMKRVERDQLGKRTIEEEKMLPDLQFPQCSICLLDFRLGDDLLLMPNCSHYFHQNCLDIWLKVCRITTLKHNNN